MRDASTWLYPPIEPFLVERVRVSPVHELYVEHCGNPDGKPVVFLHGGPGAHISPKHRQLFDPTRYHAVLFDQRGCGKSTPHASTSLEQSTVDNTTWTLVEDIETLRERAGIRAWQVFGGSWGSTLALAYAQAHPGRVTELVLRGIFLGTKPEIDWLYEDGNLKRFFPEGWNDFIAPVPAAERGDMLRAYQRLVMSNDAAVRLAAARAWTVWETLLSNLVTTPTQLEEAREEKDALASAIMEIHYFVNGCFLRSDEQLLEDVHKVRHIPATIVQGRYDVVCPFEAAWRLHEAWPEAELRVIADAGHSAFETNIARALVSATDLYAGR
jgi:proline iminopeptidase